MRRIPGALDRRTWSFYRPSHPLPLSLVQGRYTLFSVPLIVSASPSASKMDLMSFRFCSLALSLVCGFVSACLPADRAQFDSDGVDPGAVTQKTTAPLDIDLKIIADRTFGEAPALADRVGRGELPPVSERLPENPLIVVPLDEIGRYGGVLSQGGIAREHP